MIPKTPGQKRAFDLPSALTSVAMFGLAVSGSTRSARGRNADRGAAELIGAVAIGWFFIRRQLATPLPMFAVDLFAQARFTLAVVACYTSFISQTIAFVVLPFSFQTVLGHTPLQVGALLLPWLLASAAVAPSRDHWPTSTIHRGLRRSASHSSRSACCRDVARCRSLALDIAWRMALCVSATALSVAEQSGDSKQRAARAQRRPASDPIRGPRLRPDDRCRHCRHRVCPRRARSARSGISAHASF